MNRTDKAADVDVVETTIGRKAKQHITTTTTKNTQEEKEKKRGMR
jgi:hypothetical protein